MRLLEDVLTTQFKNLQAFMRNPGEKSYFIGLFADLAMNLAFTRPMMADPSTDLIEFGLDGRAFNTTADSYVTPAVEQKIERFDRSHSDQIFLHESTVEDIVKSILPTVFPFEYKTKALSQLLGIYMPELTGKYGLDAEYKFEIAMDNAFRLHFKTGMGAQLMNTGFVLKIYGKQSGWISDEWEEALEFTIHADLDAVDVAIQDLVVLTHIGDIKIKETYL